MKRFEFKYKSTINNDYLRVVVEANSLNDTLIFFGSHYAFLAEIYQIREL